MSGTADNTGATSPADKVLGLRDEFRLLLLCARTRVNPQQREQIRELVLKPLDWDFIHSKAQQHALIPLLYRNLNEHASDRVPPAVLQQLETDYGAIAERNRNLTAELIRLMRLLEMSGISTVPYKGPSLAALAYGDITLRKFFDLDVIIRRRDVIAAKSLLVSQGYQWRPFHGQWTGRKEARNFRVWHEYNFIKPDDRINIDVHWRICSRRFPFDIDLDGLWERLEPAHLLDEEIRVFPPELQVLFLCVHGGKDLWWRRIGWICDIAELVGSNPGINWSYVLELATQSGARRMLLLGLALASELLQAPLPEQVSTLIRSSSSVRSLTELTRQRLFDGQTVRFPILDKFRFRLRVRERLKDRIPVYQHLLRTLFVMTFVPNVNDREMVKLPDSLSGLYYLVRPARLAQRFWSQTIRRSNTTS